jgi:DNA polymerase-3 subunit chi
MTRIDFYKLKTQDERSRRITACRLIEKAYTQGHQVFVCTDSESGAQALDDLLWTFRQGSFVPHARIGRQDYSDAQCPVLIGHEDLMPVSGDILVNLSGAVPSYCAAYTRVLELVDMNEPIRQQGRTRYRTYRAEGHELFDHDLD